VSLEISRELEAAQLSNSPRVHSKVEISTVEESLSRLSYLTGLNLPFVDDLFVNYKAFDVLKYSNTLGYIVFVAGNDDIKYLGKTRLYFAKFNPTSNSLIGSPTAIGYTSSYAYPMYDKKVKINIKSDGQLVVHWQTLDTRYWGYNVVNIRQVTSDNGGVTWSGVDSYPHHKILEAGLSGYRRYTANSFKFFGGGWADYYGGATIQKSKFTTTNNSGFRFVFKGTGLDLFVRRGTSSCKIKVALYSLNSGKKTSLVPGSARTIDLSNNTTFAQQLSVVSLYDYLVKSEYMLEVIKVSGDTLLVDGAMVKNNFECINFNDSAVAPYTQEVLYSFDKEKSLIVNRSFEKDPTEDWDYTETGEPNNVITWAGGGGNTGNRMLEISNVGGGSASLTRVRQAIPVDSDERVLMSASIKSSLDDHSVVFVRIQFVDSSDNVIISKGSWGDDYNLSSSKFTKMTVFSIAPKKCRKAYIEICCGVHTSGKVTIDDVEASTLNSSKKVEVVNVLIGNDGSMDRDTSYWKNYRYPPSMTSFFVDTFSILHRIEQYHHNNKTSVICHTLISEKDLSNTWFGKLKWESNNVMTQGWHTSGKPVYFDGIMATQDSSGLYRIYVNKFVRHVNKNTPLYFTTFDISFWGTERELYDNTYRIVGSLSLGNNSKSYSLYKSKLYTHGFGRTYNTVDVSDYVIEANVDNSDDDSSNMSSLIMDNKDNQFKTTETTSELYGLIPVDEEDRAVRFVNVYYGYEVDVEGTIEYVKEFSGILANVSNVSEDISDELRVDCYDYGYQLARYKTPHSLTYAGAVYDFLDNFDGYIPQDNFNQNPNSKIWDTTIKFTDDFSKSLSSWRKLSAVTIENKKLKFSGSGTLLSLRGMTNGIFSCRAKCTSGNDFSIVFRANDNNNHYFFRASGLDTNKARLYKKVIGGYDIIEEVSFSTPSTNTWFRYKIVLQDSTISCYVNGAKLIEHSADTTFTSGYFGFRSGSTVGYIDDAKIMGGTELSTDIDNWKVHGQDQVLSYGDSAGTYGELYSKALRLYGMSYACDFLFKEEVNAGMIARCNNKKIDYIKVGITPGTTWVLDITIKRNNNSIVSTSVDIGKQVLTEKHSLRLSVTKKVLNVYFNDSLKYRKTGIVSDYESNRMGLFAYGHVHFDSPRTKRLRDIEKTDLSIVQDAACRAMQSYMPVTMHSDSTGESYFTFMTWRPGESAKEFLERLSRAYKKKLRFTPDGSLLYKEDTLKNSVMTITDDYIKRISVNFSSFEYTNWVYAAGDKDGKEYSGNVKNKDSINKYGVRFELVEGAFESDRTAVFAAKQEYYNRNEGLLVGDVEVLNPLLHLDIGDVIRINSERKGINEEFYISKVSYSFSLERLSFTQTLALSVRNKIINENLSKFFGDKVEESEEIV